MITTAIESVCKYEHTWFAQGDLHPDGAVDYSDEESVFCPFCFEPDRKMEKEYGVMVVLDDSERTTIIGMYREIWSEATGGIVHWVDHRLHGQHEFM